MATIGNLTTPTSSYPAQLNRCLVSKFVAPFSATITAGQAYFDPSSTAGSSAKVVAYTDNNSAPSTLISASSAVAIPAGGNLINFPSMSGSIVAGHYYWIGLVSNNSNASYGYTSTSSSSAMVMTQSSSTFYATPPSTWPTTTSSYSGSLITVALVVTLTGGGQVFLTFGGDPF